MSIVFGKTYRDIVTGFEGICTGAVEWMYGCKDFALQPRSETNNKRERAALFNEKQMELVDDGIVDKIEQPIIDEPVLFGKECVDKVTGVRGMCIGRGIWLFSSTQYVLEVQPEDKEKESRFMWLDAGRVEQVKDPTHEIDPKDVAGPRPGGVHNPSWRPPMNPLEF